MSVGPHGSSWMQPWCCFICNEGPNSAWAGGHPVIMQKAMNQISDHYINVSKQQELQFNIPHSIPFPFMSIHCERFLQLCSSWFPNLNNCRNSQSVDLSCGCSGSALVFWAPLRLFLPLRHGGAQAAEEARLVTKIDLAWEDGCFASSHSAVMSRHVSPGIYKKLYIYKSYIYIYIYIYTYTYTYIYIYSFMGITRKKQTWPNCRPVGRFKHNVGDRDAQWFKNHGDSWGNKQHILGRRGACFFSPVSQRKNRHTLQ
jgi:hypothetical protein